MWVPRREKKSSALLILLSLTFAGLFSPVTLSTDSPSRLEANTAFAAGSLPLTVTVSATPTAGKVPLNVSFSGTVSGGTPPYAVFWDFGDTTSSTGSARVNHTYTAPGSFTAQFWAQDSAGARTFAPVTLNVLAVGGLRVSTVDLSGKPVASVLVQMLSQPQGQDPLSGTTALNGSLNFGPVAVGTYSLKASASGFENSTAMVTVTPNSTSLATMKLSPEAKTSLDLTTLVPYIATGVGATVFLGLFFLRKRKRRPVQGRPRSTSRPERPRGSTRSTNR